MSSVTIKEFGVQTGTDRSVYVTWNWDEENTANYQVRWFYYTGDDVWFVGTDTTVDVRQSIYSAPTNAKAVRVVVKPISKTYKEGDTDVYYWTADWSTEKICYFTNDPPLTPPVPKVSVKNNILTATLDNLNVSATSIEFQVIRDNARLFSSGEAKIVTYHAAFSCVLSNGGEYKVRCRSCKDVRHSEWSEYSESVSTAPSALREIRSIKATSETSVRLDWGVVPGATKYDIQYTTKLEYFDGSDQVQDINGIEGTSYEKTGLETGEEYFFRIRAVNDSGESAWSAAKSVVIGKAPAAPTTWSSSTTVITGEKLVLYWTHNSEDGSNQTYADIEIYIGNSKESYTVTDDPEDDKDINSFEYDTSPYIEGAKIQWRVRTAGITKDYGEWSIQRTVDIYYPPTLELNVTNLNGEDIETLGSFPFYVNAKAGPNSQTPVGYHLDIISRSTYETTDSIGNVKTVKSGDSVYSKYFYTSDELLVEFSANNINLENNVQYIVKCTVSMDSGLNATRLYYFKVGWSEVVYEPNAEIGINANNYTAMIRPYCMDKNGVLVDDFTLAVYRREFDGGFTEIASGIDNIGYTFVTDPHPSLDFARYRIVATSKTTGAVSYYDMPAHPVGGKAVVIQWAEDWSSFDVTSADRLEQPTWVGSMLKLPYNIDVSDDYKPDVAVIQYIGRERPVSYYGTQLGETSTWNVEIEKSDKETLYALRRLANWMGDVYVREPSGSGYWANISVSFSQKHCNMVIPVTLNITRVEGGV